jgi:hypothetical protein
MFETVNFDLVLILVRQSFICICFAVTRALFQQQAIGYTEFIMYIVKNGL